MGLGLSVQQVSALETRTEGWVAGLQMAAPFSIQGLEREDDVSAFVTDFAGSHRYVFDYLTDEVLQQRPPHTRTFLLETSILDRFNASLCAAVTSQPDCARTLASLERANLFLFPLDEQRQWVPLPPFCLPSYCAAACCAQGLNGCCICTVGLPNGSRCGET